MNAIPFLIGIALLVAYLGVLIWSIAAWSFATITGLVLLLLLYDLIYTLRHGENGNGA